MFGFVLTASLIILSAGSINAEVIGNGSDQNPIILDCTASSGQFVSMTGLYGPSLNTKIKIDGSDISVWIESDKRWILHPCVYASGDGQFCSISPVSIRLKQSHQYAWGHDINDLKIDRRDGVFTFNNTLIIQGERPEYRNASGSCLPGNEPELPRALF